MTTKALDMFVVIWVMILVIWVLGQIVDKIIFADLGTVLISLGLTGYLAWIFKDMAEKWIKY
jgi:hypothetical protein